MDQVEVQVSNLQSLQRFFQSGFHVLRVVECVPELAGDEQILAFHDSSLDLGVNRVADFVLVPVDEGTVDVSVADVNGIFDSLLDLSRWRLREKNAYQLQFFLPRLITLTQLT